MKRSSWTPYAAILSLLALTAPASATAEALKLAQTFYPALDGSLDFSPDSRSVAFAVVRNGADDKVLSGGNLLICPVDQPKEQCRGFGGGRKDWEGVRFSVDGRLIASVGSATPHVWIWSAETLQPVKKLSGVISLPASGMAFSPDGKLLALAQNDRVQVYSTESGALVREPEFAIGGFGINLQVAEGKVVVKDPTKGAPAQKEGILEGDEIREVDGRAFAGLSLADVVAILRGDPGTKARLTVFRPSAAKEKRFTVKRARISIPVYSVFFLPDGRLAAQTGDGDRVWSSDLGHPPAKVGGWLSRDGRLFSVVEKGKNLSLKSFPDGRELGVIKDYPAGAPLGRFSADGRYLAVAEPSGRLTFFDTQDGEPRGVLELGEKVGTQIAFSPDGRYLAFHDGSVRLYDNPMAPRRYVVKPEAELKSTSGKTLTRLPLGAEVAVERYTPSGYFVRMGSSLQGYVKAEDLSCDRPDILKPVVRVMEKSFKDPVLTVKGVAYDDIAVASVWVGGAKVPRAAFDFDKGNYADGYPFEAKVALTPEIQPSIRAEDKSGKVTEVPISIEEPVLDYVPRYATVETLRKAEARKSPSPEAEPLASLEAKTVLVALGEKDAWYYLEGGGWLAKADARQLEATQPPAEEKPLSVSAGAQAAPRPLRAASDVDRPAYAAKENPDNFAMVVGIEKYSGIPEAQFAERDAAAVKAHLLAMGYPERNIIYLTGQQASRAGIAKMVESWLPRNVKEDSSVFFYYSGHGAPDTQTGQAYLLPWDGDAQFLEDTAYPIRRLYEKLNALKAKRVVAALDACFSGGGGRSVLTKGARPLVTNVDSARGAAGRLVVFTASAADEITGTDENQGHGLFTYYFLKGLGGAAQDKYGRVTAKGLYDYVVPNVRDAARRQNRDQSPQLLSPGAGAAAGLDLR